MVRGGMLSQNSGTNTLIALGDECKDLPGSRGPLSQRMLSVADVPASNISMLADAAAGDSDEAVLSDTLNTALPAGSRLVESFNDGPAFWDATNGRVRLLDSGDDGHHNRPFADYIPQQFPTVGELVTEANESTFAANVTGPQLYLQDTRDFFAVHGSQCNVLMADGSVKAIDDQNGDGFLNPGFPVNSSVNTALASTVGYTDGVCETNHFETFFGIELSSSFQEKGTLE